MGSVPASIASLRAFYKVKITDLSVEDILETVEGESDRAVVVILGSFLEGALTHRLRHRLNLMSDEQIEDLRIFAFDGPMGSFSLKINMALAMSEISEQTHTQLNIVREMRNACAHSFRHIDFATPELAAVCARLMTGARLPPDLGDWPDDPTREDYRGGFTAEGLTLFMTIILKSRAKALKLVAQHKPLPDK